MSEYLVSWGIGRAPNCQGGKLKNPAWGEVAKVLSDARESAGSVTIDKLGKVQVGPKSLDVQTENGFSILSLGEETEDDYVVRSFSNSSAKATSIEILGNVWDMRLVCTDFEVVVQAFKEFYEIGDVSKEILS